MESYEVKYEIYCVICGKQLTIVSMAVSGTMTDDGKETRFIIKTGPCSCTPIKPQ